MDFIRELFTKRMNIILSFILPLLLVIIVEFITRSDNMLWVIQNPSKLLYSYLLCFALVNIFRILSNKVYYFSLVLITATFVIMSLVSKIKFSLRGEPLLPADFLLIKEAFNISKYIGSSLGPVIAIGVVVIFLIFVVIKLIKMPRTPYVLKYNIPVSIIGLLIMFVMITNKPVDMEKALGVSGIPWAQAMSYDENGFVPAFFISAKDFMAPTKPENYTKEHVGDVVTPYVEQGKVRLAEGGNEGEVKPNVIFIMAEAFWDPTWMEGVTFNQDPIPIFHGLEKEYTSGKLVVPAYGGNTANTEFEVLTGLSVHGMPSGSVPYNQIGKPIDSLAHIFREQGYTASAVHSYYGWFYNRNSIYKNLGFNQFISIESFQNQENTNGIYLKDEEVGKRIMEETDKSEGSDFIYAVTMQSHGPYEDERLTSKNTTVTSDLDSHAKQLLEIYANQIGETEEMVQDLIKYYEAKNEPTVIVMFGDHLPFLGNSYEVYKAAGFATDPTDYENYNKLHEVPFVMWNNIELEKEENLRMSTSFLGSYVLDRLGIKGNAVTDVLNEGYKAGIKVIPEEEHFVQESMKMEWWRQYSLLQYDVMYGKGHLYNITPKPGYAEGYMFNN